MDHVCPVRRIPSLLVVALLAGTAAPPAAAQVTGTRLGTDAPGLSSQKAPRIVRAPAPGDPDVAHVVWEDLRLGKWMISHQRLSGAGVAGPETVVSETDAQGDPRRNATDPAAVVDVAGELHVAWRAFGSGHERVMISSAQPGLPFTQPMALNAGRPSEYVSPPVMAVDAAGRLVVAWSQSDGFWDQVLVRMRDPALGWLPTILLTGAADPLDPPVFPSTGGHHEGVELTLDAQGHVTLAGMFQEVIGQRRVRVWRGDLSNLAPGGITFSEQLFVDTEFAYGCPGGACLPDEAAFIDLASWADPLSPLRTVTVVAWVDLTQDGSGVIATHLKSSWSVGGSPFSAEEAVSPFVGAGEPYYLDLQLAAGVNGRVHALYGRVDPPYCFEPLRVVANRFDPDFTLQDGAWSETEHLLNCDPGTCFSCGPPPAVFGPQAMCGPAPLGVVVKGYLPLLPRASLEASETGAVVATWMESIADPMGYAYVASARSLNGGMVWNMGQPVTTPGATGATAGTPGSARAGFADVSVRGNHVLLAWDDRRSWTHPDDPPGPARGSPDVYVAALGQPSLCAATSMGGAP